MQIAVSSPLLSLTGRGFAGPVAPAGSSTPARSGSSWTAEDQAFGVALVREGRRPSEMALYGPDARLRSTSQSAQSEEEAVEARTVQALEQRDQEVRRKEESGGEAVGGSQFVYQTGPDGRQYAVGSTAHVVRKEEDDGGESDGGSGVPGSEDLSAEDKALVEKLRARDGLVRGHETAHIMAAGGQAQGPARYEYQTGPDGRQYAIGGSVSIAVGSSTGDPEDTARSADVARRAAMATGESSLRDMQVAMRASELSARAKQRGLETYAGQAGFAGNAFSSPVESAAGA